MLFSSVLVGVPRGIRLIGFIVRFLFESSNFLCVELFPFRYNIGKGCVSKGCKRSETRNRDLVKKNETYRDCIVRFFWIPCLMLLETYDCTS